MTRGHEGESGWGNECGDVFFFFNDTATTEIYTLSLHDALPILCHGVCHSPMSYFLTRWKTGFGGGLRMGLGLGAFCIGCCWGFMALGFVGGVMNLAWMGLATLFMVIEKLPQIGHYTTKPMTKKIKVIQMPCKNA